MNSTLITEINELLQKLKAIEKPEAVISMLLELAAKENSNQIQSINTKSTEATSAEIIDEIRLTHHLEQIEGNAYETVISDVERQLIMYALKRSRYIKTKASEYLGINRNTLDKRIRELKIDY